MFDHPANLRHPSPWYLFDAPSLLYFSPALLFNDPLELAANQTLNLHYRVLVHSHPLSAQQIDAAWQHFAAPPLAKPPTRP